MVGLGCSSSLVAKRYKKDLTLTVQHTRQSLKLKDQLWDGVCGTLSVEFLELEEGAGKAEAGMARSTTCFFFILSFLPDTEFYSYTKLITETLQLKIEGN